MEAIATNRASNFSELVEQFSRETSSPETSTIPFADSTDALATLLSSVRITQNRLLSGGIYAHDTAIAADRAGLTIEEIVGNSPFKADVCQLTGAISNKDELVHIANPNRISGAMFTLDELKKTAELLPNGMLIIEESTLNRPEISALHLLETHSNIAVLKSIPARFGLYSSPGFLVGFDRIISELKETSRWPQPSSSQQCSLREALSEPREKKQGQKMYQEMIRLGKGLGRLGIQVRLTPSDYVLLRVASPTRVGNWLASDQISFENLDGYTGMQKYIRFIVQSPSGNDRLIDSFQRMPKDLYRLVDFDNRTQLLTRGSELIQKNKQRFV